MFPNTHQVTWKYYNLKILINSLNIKLNLKDLNYAYLIIIFIIGILIFHYYNSIFKKIMEKILIIEIKNCVNLTLNVNYYIYLYCVNLYLNYLIITQYGI